MAKVDLSAKLRDARARSQADEGLREPVPEAPLFARLSRKEVRVREDQLAALGALARELMRARRIKAERITENTLIRVAIDLLLAQHTQLRGATEHELRASVTSAPPESRTSSVPNSPTSEGPNFHRPEVPNFRSPGQSPPRTGPGPDAAVAPGVGHAGGGVSR